MSDQVNSPDHYQFGQMEAWDIIELAIEGIADPVTAYHAASALKYLLRAARKNGDEDIAKAEAHLKREVARHVVRVPPAPEYDPDDVAFRHDVVAKLGEAAVSEVCGACGKDDVPNPGTNLPKTAIEIGAADGAIEYGNPITPWRLP